MRAGVLSGRTVVLEPLRVEHAEEMAVVLADAELYRFTGGEPPSADELRARYAAQVRGRSGEQWWLNWVIRAQGAAAAGYVQATVEGGIAELAWVVGVAHQGRGLARESVGLVAAWLRGLGVVRLIAHVHPDHAASAAVARGVGMVPTSVVEDGERLWEGLPPAP
ncbi:GNAT family N-acetyltransferase [Actinokineospora guangxiensis]|uniref:GNAT family N-acetyltransferase n=1 Tax=Actinokineospora guangxiensis TaxID=1490288 RepID=A0ABW0EKN8_9PSEU